jgi:hypothetical protein
VQAGQGAYVHCTVCGWCTGDAGCRVLSYSVLDVGEINMAARFDRLSARNPNLFGFLVFYLVSKYVFKRD